MWWGLPEGSFLHIGSWVPTGSYLQVGTGSTRHSNPVGRLWTLWRFVQGLDHLWSNKNHSSML